MGKSPVVFDPQILNNLAGYSNLSTKKVGSGATKDLAKMGKSGIARGPTEYVGFSFGSIGGHVAKRHGRYPSNQGSSAGNCQQVGQCNYNNWGQGPNGCPCLGPTVKNINGLVCITRMNVAGSTNGTAAPAQNGTVTVGYSTPSSYGPKSVSGIKVAEMNTAGVVPSNPNGYPCTG